MTADAVPVNVGRVPGGVNLGTPDQPSVRVCGERDSYRFGGAIWSELGGIEFAGGAAAAWEAGVGAGLAAAGDTMVAIVVGCTGA